MTNVKRYTAKLMELSDKPDCNGRVYDSQTLKKAVAEYNKKQGGVVLDINHGYVVCRDPNIQTACNDTIKSLMDIIKNQSI